MLVVSRIIELMLLQLFRHEFKVCKMAGIIMGILVSVSISEFLHQFGRSIPEIEGNRSVTSLFCYFKSLIYSHICRIALSR